MLKYLILSFLIISEISLIGQKKQTYEGPYQNGIPAKATARYFYIQDKFGKKIKDGSFRYIVKEKANDQRLVQNFKGDYSQGLKDGEWEYSIKSKDYGSDEDGFAISSEINLIASYSQGYPDGRWEYSALIYKRKHKAGGDLDEKILVKDVKMLLNFKMGVLVDSIQIHDNQGVYIDVLCDELGFLNGDFIIKSKEFVLHNQYSDGFLVKENENASKEYIYYQANKSLKNRGFVIDTITYFNEKTCLITNYLNDNIFNKEYFLFNYIEGDRMFKRNNRGYVISISYKGLYVKELRVKLTSSEEKLIKDIWYYNTKVQELVKNTKIAVKKDPDNKELKKKLNTINGSASQIKGYICIANQCKNYIVISDLIEASESCGNVASLIKGLNNKEAILNRMLEASKAAYVKADKVSKQ